jgi:FlaG/FlaF family flagellin (archaellin)
MYYDFIFVKYREPRVSGHRRSQIMRSIIKSKTGISPILATLLLIVIAVAAVIVTYAWVMTFTTSTTNQAGAVLTVENTRFYNSGGDKVEIVIRNSGTGNAKVAEVYRGESASDLQQASSVTYSPTSQMVSAGESLKITFSYNWDSGTRYYFKVVTEEGINIPFSAEP